MQPDFEVLLIYFKLVVDLEKNISIPKTCSVNVSLYVVTLPLIGCCFKAFHWVIGQ